MPDPACHSQLSVVIPVYRSEAALPTLVQRLRPTLAALACKYELVLVNDGSPDRSWEVIQQLAAQHGWVRGIRLMRNYGQHNALLAGIRAARFDTIVTMDDDLQHPPEELPKLLAKMEEGFDVVYGTPEQEQHGLLRDLASLTTKIALQSAMGAETAREVSAWRVFRTQLRDAFVSYHSPFVSIDVLLTWGTNKSRKLLYSKELVRSHWPCIRVPATWAILIIVRVCRVKPQYARHLKKIAPGFLKSA